MQFSDFQFDPRVLHAVEQCGFKQPTPIQEQAIGPILAGRDMVGLAQTGTGKTAAFMLPIVQRLLQKRERHIRALIVAPTRKLAEQIHAFAEKICAGTPLRSAAIYGGVGKAGQVAKVGRGVDIVVACPGRLLDLIADKAVALDRIEHLVLDEADHMFDQGFLPDIRRILRHVPARRQTLLFSATMPQEIRALAQEILREPETVQVNRLQPAETISHTLYHVRQEQKFELLLQVLRQDCQGTSLVFTRTKFRAKSIAQKLERCGFKAVSLQGNLSQNRRQQALEGFKNGSFTILVATDIAARGIDVADIAHVINLDAPDTAEAYIHRTGRTGRATRSGEAMLFATADDARIVAMIERSLQKKMRKKDVALAAGEEQPAAVRPLGPAKREKGCGKKPHAAAKGRSNERRSASAGSVFGLPARNR